MKKAIYFLLTLLMVAGSVIGVSAAKDDFEDGLIMKDYVPKAGLTIESINNPFGDGKVAYVRDTLAVDTYLALNKYFAALENEGVVSFDVNFDKVKFRTVIEIWGKGGKITSLDIEPGGIAKYNHKGGSVDLGKIFMPDKLSNIKFMFKIKTQQFSLHINGKNISGDVEFIEPATNVSAVAFMLNRGSEIYLDNVSIEKEAVISENLSRPTETTTPTSQADDGTIKVFLNGTKLTFDQPPIITNGRTLLPLRKIFEELGANIEWFEDTETVIATKDNIKIKLTIGSDLAYVNNVEKKLDQPAEILNNRTLVPVRFVSEAMGADVKWDSVTSSINITQ